MSLFKDGLKLGDSERTSLIGFLIRCALWCSTEGIGTLPAQYCVYLSTLCALLIIIISRARGCKVFLPALSLYLKKKRKQCNQALGLK